MTKQIFLVHGRNFKPVEDVIKASWIDALTFGIIRDYPDDGAQKLENAQIQFVYYGDLSNDYLRNRGDDYDEDRDVDDRQSCLSTLMKYETKDFLGDRGKEIYRELEGKNALKEALADVFAGPLRMFRLSEPVITAVAPDMRQYWNPDSAFGSGVRWRLTQPLGDALVHGHDVLLITHSLATMVAYDVLWKFSYYGEYQDLRQQGLSLSHWITLGSPLGDETVKDNLKGAAASGNRRYPTLIDRWDNVSAEDDYIAHDQRIANDFENMVESNLVQSIVDRRIYNLAVRQGQSNPHHGAGYLIHPTVSRLVYEWLGLER